MSKNILLIQAAYNKVFVIAVLISLFTIMCISLQQGYTKLRDNFFRKTDVVQSYNYLRYVLGTKIYSFSVIIGQDGWLIFANDKNLDDYQNAIPFSEQQLLQIEKKVDLVNEFGEKNDVQFFIVIAPNKETIYPEIVPNTIPIIGKISRFDQVLDSLKPYSNVQILDLRNALQGMRQAQETYYHTDTHWNDFGAYVAYTEIIKLISQNYSELEIYPQELLLTARSEKIFDLANTAGLNFIHEPDIQLIPPTNAFESIATSKTFGYHQTTKVTTINTPTILIYHDSFGNKLNKYLSLSFETSHFIRYDEDKHFLPNAIQGFKPDIVVIVLVERHIHFLKDILPLVISE